ncbi:MAG: alpha/beta hydrolase, partial [Mycobacterium sp.]|nr:alpha/beta hydrolase [Mycobacterium sp.]
MAERPTVAQARGWQPGALTDLAEAWDRAAGGVQIQLDDTARQIAGTGDFWSGSAAQEARARIEEVIAPGRAAARALIAAAAAARDGARRIGAARRDAVDTADAAVSDGYDVADAGTVTAPRVVPELTRLLCGGDDDVARALLVTRAAELTELLVAALNRLGAADQDTADQIDAAFGGTSAAVTTAAGAATLTPTEVVAAWPTMSQDRIAAQLAAMTEDERRRLVDAAPLAVGNTDGVPWPLRMAANRINVADAILAQRAVVDLPDEDKITRMFAAGLGLDTGSAERVWLAAHADPGVRAAIVATHDREASARIDFYEGLLAAVPDPTRRTGELIPRQLVSFDPDRASFIELTGDLSA